MKLFFLSLGVLFFPFCLYALDSSGLQYALAADVIYQQNIDGETDDSGKLNLREVELIFFGPIDQSFDAVISVVAHEHDNTHSVELHEAYIESSKLLNRSNIKLGQFFLGIGRLNRIHRHDWAFSVTPKVQKELLAGEGIYDAGVEYNYLFDTQSYLNWTLGLSSGHKFGHDHESHSSDNDHHDHSHSSSPKTPTYYTRVSHFIELGGSNGIEWGVNYLGRKDNESSRYHLTGVDFTAKWREGRVVVWNLQSEWWYQNKKNHNNQKSDYFGGYLFVERGLSPNWSLGLRGDFYREDHDEKTWAVSPSVTYRNSEFSWFRASIYHQFEGDHHAHSHDHNHDKETRVELQIVFILGAHPAHSF